MTTIKDVCKGDKVKVSGDEITEVKCLVKIPRDSSKPLTSLYGDLTITPNHPIRVNKVWTLPSKVSSH